jgi:ABC-type proline/glycine betaine transport system substrate-binding protein
MKRRSGYGSFLCYSAAIPLGLVSRSSAAIPCNDTLTCERLVRPGSVCLTSPDGGGSVCSNPFASGCLQNYLGTDQFPHKRVCSSYDDDSTPSAHCDPPPMEYQEIRILSQNWDSSLFTGWALQIFLSEVVRVPVSLEPSDPHRISNFYDPYNRFDYGAQAYDWDALKTAHQVGDCVPISNQVPYQSCAHVMPEVWSGQRQKYLQSEHEGWTEAAGSTGGVAKLSWYIPRYVAEMDSSLLSYFGLRGEENRRKLADLFLTPFTWHDYCTQISPTGCHNHPPIHNTTITTDAHIAIRPPATEEEGGMYFVPGQYWGYFGKTEQNDCDQHPTTCTGHIANVPCDWTTNLVQQAYHNDIALKSTGPLPVGGYGYAEMQQVWFAANHSKYPLIVYWWTPDPLIQDLVGTELEFQPILLPPPSQECVETRVTPEQRCSALLEDQAGLASGACDSEAHSLHQIVVANLATQMVDSKSPAEINPAYQATKEFRITDLEMATIFRHWLERGTDRWGYDPHEAVCQFVADNLEDMQRFVPRSFPREVRKVQTNWQLVNLVALAFGLFGCCLLVITAALVWKWQSTKEIRYAQKEFLLLVLGGLFMISVGAVWKSREPTTYTCLGSSWAILLGYTLELVALIVKTAAIATLVEASKKLRRIKLARRTLFQTVVAFLLLVGIYLVCLSLMDPPTRQTHFQLTDKKTENGWYQVDAHYYCASEQKIWNYLAVAWQVFLLAIALVLAIKTRAIVPEFNESRRLGLTVYSHSFFVILRIITSSLTGTIANMHAFQRYVASGDALATLLIYFAPMFLSIVKKDEVGQSSSRNVTGLKSSIRKGFEGRLSFFCRSNGVL